MGKRILTAESVTSGHPDKLADLIADSILDACLEQDKDSRVACEVLLTAGKVIIAGEITTKAIVDYIEMAKMVIEEVGYDTKGVEFEARIHLQSPDIAGGVFKVGEQGAGDQGIVYGYATDETLDFLPLPIELAHRLTDRLEYCRTEGIIKGLLPDGKSQVSVEYKDGKLSKITSITLSTQHETWKSVMELHENIKKNVIDYVFRDIALDKDTEVLINPSGKFVLGGFEADTGLTGRKLMVDSYGGIAHHGGGAYSGKDASKVDRSGAYMARYVAKNIVAAGLASKCEVSIGYAIGRAEPTFVDVNTFGTSEYEDEVIATAVNKVFDLRPGAIIEALDLKMPIYAQTAVGGHFGKEYLMWEQLNKVEEIREAVLNG